MNEDPNRRWHNLSSLHPFLLLKIVSMLFNENLVHTQCGGVRSKPISAESLLLLQIFRESNDF